MPETKTYQGRTYSRNGPNDPWVLQPQGPSPVTIGTPDPNASTRSGAETQRAVAEAQTATAEAPYAGDIAAADRDRAIAEAEKARIAAAEAAAERANAPNPQSKLIQESLKTDSVISRLNKARAQIEEGWATGNFAGTSTFQGVPFAGQNSANLSATLEGLKGGIINDTIAQLKALSPTGASGYGSLTQTEADRLAASVGALQQDQDAETLLAELGRVERHYRNSLALLNGEDPRIPEVAERYGVATDAGSEGDGQETPSGNLTSDGRFEDDPGLSGANAKVREIILSGGSADDVRDYLNRLRPGYGDQVQGIPQAVARIRQNPDEANSFNVDVEKVWVPNTGIQKTLGDIGMSGPGAALIGAADTASLGFLDNMTSNPDMARAVMSGVEEESPWWYLGGQVAGGAATGLGLERAAMGLGAKGITAARVGETGFGAGYGAGIADDEDDSRITNALLGATGGLVGGEVGRRAASTIGRGIAGVGDAAQRTLNAAGVRMTPGQILGGGVKAFEDRLAGLPVVGDAIQARRMEGLDDFNIAAFNEALAPAGKSTDGAIRATGIDLARQMRGETYDEALDGVYATADDQFDREILDLLARSGDVPEAFPGDVGYTLETRIGSAFDEDLGVTGRDYQQALRGLRRDAKSVENQPYGYDFGDFTREGDEVVTALLERQNPGVSASLGTANEVNKRVETLRDAVHMARNSDEIFRPSQLSNAAAKTARRFGNSQGTTNQPFYELARAGQEVLPSQIPDSGTAGRLVIPAIAGAAAGGGSYANQEGEEAAPSGSTLGTAGIAALLAAAPYSASARNTLQRAMMAERPDIVQRAGERLIDDREIAALLAAPIGTFAATN